MQSHSHKIQYQSETTALHLVQKGYGPTMKTTHANLVEILSQIAKPTYVVFGYESAKGNYLAAIAKINFDYKAELNAQQIAEGQEVTEPGQRPWGIQVPGTPLISHKGNFYLACWITQTITHTNKDGQAKEDILHYKDLKIERIKMLVIAERVFNVE